jgi:hypothetical protein
VDEMCAGISRPLLQPDRRRSHHLSEPFLGIAPVRPTSDRYDTQQFTPSLCRTDIEISIKSKIEGAGFTLLRTNYEESQTPSQTYE